MNEILEMIKYNSGDIRRITHSLKVYAYAKAIAEGENLSGEDKKILLYAAALHDIGIKKAEELFGKCNGKLQEEYGPDVAKGMLANKSDEIINKVCFLIGHHHSYGTDGGILLQILFEADFLVNIEEGEFGDTPPRKIRDKFFKTKTGLQIFYCVYK